MDVKNRKTRTIASVIGSSPKSIKKTLQNKKITKSEVHSRLGFIFLGVFAAYLVEPMHQYIESIGVNPIIIAVVGIIGTFYFFDF